MRRITVNFVITSLLIFLPLVSAFAQTDTTPRYAVLLDNTRSLQKQFPQVVLIGKAVINRIHKDGPVSLFSFSYKRDGSSYVIPFGGVYEGTNYDRAVPALGIDGSQDQTSLYRYVDGLAVVRGQTDLHGAIQSMAEMLNAKSSEPRTPPMVKVMILITDGEHRMDGGIVSRTEIDNARRKRERQLIKSLKENGITVYVVGLVRELDAYGSALGVTTREKAESFLNHITKETGGRVVFPKSKKTDADMLLSELFGK